MDINNYVVDTRKRRWGTKVLFANQSMVVLRVRLGRQVCITIERSLGKLPSLPSILTSQWSTGQCKHKQLWQPVLGTVGRQQQHSYRSFLTMFVLHSRLLLIPACYFSTQNVIHKALFTESGADNVGATHYLMGCEPWWQSFPLTLIQCYFHTRVTSPNVA